MIKQSENKFRAVIAPVGLALSLALGGVGVANASSHGGTHGPYLNDSQGKMVFNGAGECWRNIGGINVPVAECGDVVEMDADKDGVVDSRDECPGTPSGVPVNTSGCPKDSDGDWIADYKDNCPGTPKGTKVDKFGCAIPAAAATVNVTADHFDFDSSMLKDAMKSVLNGVVDMLKATPADEALEIVGHTDSTGPDAYNQKLSERRAQSVADYLAGEGVTNMSIKGMGESLPVADNGTSEGRAMNRRVEVMSR